ncbi:MAG: SMC-Scp complex subunit ScpB [Halioglobus sp.]|nr:SMC-Scp complex subunit ScpB [Halioglobus sp.]
MSETGLVQILEGALLAAAKPLSVAQLAELFEEHERPEPAALREALAEVGERCEGRGFELQEVASGYRFGVRQNLSTWVARLWHERPQKYSRALLETLALIAYRQPITRGEIEEIRGVAVSSNIIKTLHEREWIRVVGHRDVPGRPAMYATTRQFLDYFGLKTLDQLPALAEIRDLETLNAELGFSEPLPEAADTAAARDTSQGLTVVGGTEHTPRGETDASGAVTLAEAAGDLGERARRMDDAQAVSPDAGDQVVEAPEPAAEAAQEAGSEASDTASEDDLDLDAPRPETRG